MAEKGTTLSPEQLRAIEALLTGATQEKAAKYAECGLRTLGRWWAEDVAFQEEFERRSQYVGRLKDRMLLTRMDGYYDELDVMAYDREGVPPAVRKDILLELTARAAAAATPSGQSVTLDVDAEGEKTETT